MVSRIDESVEDEMGEEDFPVVSHSAEQPLPIEHGSAGVQEVRDIGAIEALALHDEYLLPEDLFYGAQSGWQAEDKILRGMREPFVVHGAKPVSRVEDDVDVVVPTKRFGDPAGISQLGAVPGYGQR